MLQQRVLDVLAQARLRVVPGGRGARVAGIGGTCDGDDTVPDVGRGDPQESQRDPGLPDAPPITRGAGQEERGGFERARLVLELLRDDDHPHHRH